MRLEHLRQRAVTFAPGVHHGLGGYLSVLHIVQLELFGMSEMLKNLSVVIGDCNFHDIFLLIGLTVAPPAASTAAPSGTFLRRGGAAQLIIPALNHQRAPVHQALRQLAASRPVDGLHGGARYVHLRGALLLRQAFQVDQTDGLKLVQPHDHIRLPMRLLRRTEPPAGRMTADAPSLAGPWHGFASSKIIDICHQ